MASCKDAQDQFAKAHGDISKKCSGECFKEAMQCVRCTLGEAGCNEEELEDEEELEGDRDPEVVRLLNRAAQGRGRRGLKRNSKVEDIKKLRREFKSCPLVANDDLDKLKKDIKTLKKDKRDLEKEIRERKQKLVELQTDDAKAAQKSESEIDQAHPRA